MTNVRSSSIWSPGRTVCHHRMAASCSSDKGYRGTRNGNRFNDSGLTVVRPAYRTEPDTPRSWHARAVRQEHRIRQRNLQRPTRSRTAGGRTITASPSSPARRPRMTAAHLAQLAQRPTHHAIPDRIRTTDPWNDHLRLDRVAQWMRAGVGSAFCPATVESCPRRPREVGVRNGEGANRPDRSGELRCLAQFQPRTRRRNEQRVDASVGDEQRVPGW